MAAAAVMEELRGSFREGRTRPAEWRTAQLRALVRMIEEKEDDISDALHADLAKPRMEAYLHESPPPLCMYYRWIDTKKPDWAVTEIRERGRRAWASLDLEERRAKAAAEEKAEQEREWQEYCVKQRASIDEMKKKNREEALRLAEVYRQREEAREAERQRKKERAREAKAAEEAGDGKGKYPRWTQ